MWNVPRSPFTLVLLATLSLGAAPSALAAGWLTRIAGAHWSGIGHPPWIRAVVVQHAAGQRAAPAVSPVWQHHLAQTRQRLQVQQKISFAVQDLAARQEEAAQLRQAADVSAWTPPDARVGTVTLPVPARSVAPAAEARAPVLAVIPAIADDPAAVGESPVAEAPAMLADSSEAPPARSVTAPDAAEPSPARSNKPVERSRAASEPTRAANRSAAAPVGTVSTPVTESSVPATRQSTVDSTQPVSVESARLPIPETLTDVASARAPAVAPRAPADAVTTRLPSSAVATTGTVATVRLPSPVAPTSTAPSRVATESTEPARIASRLPVSADAPEIRTNAPEPAEIPSAEAGDTRVPAESPQSRLSGDLSCHSMVVLPGDHPLTVSVCAVREQGVLFWTDDAARTALCLLPSIPRRLLVPTEQMTEQIGPDSLLLWGEDIQWIDLAAAQLNRALVRFGESSERSVAVNDTTARCGDWFRSRTVESDSDDARAAERLVRANPDREPAGESVSESPSAPVPSSEVQRR